MDALVVCRSAKRPMAIRICIHFQLTYVDAIWDYIYIYLGSAIQMLYIVYIKNPK